MVDWTNALAGMQAASAAREAAELDLERRLERARRLIHAHHADPLDLQHIARTACLSPYHFHRKFRQLTGDTPHQYLTRRRLEHARRLLLTTELPVTEVCLQVGFQSLGSFTTLFRRHIGRPPSHYRATVVQSLGVPRPAPLLAPIPSCFLRAFAGVDV